VYIRDDQSNPEITATVGRELIEVVGVDIIVGTVSSGATATLQELARDNEVFTLPPPRPRTTSPARPSTNTPSAPAATITRTQSTSANT
jgi:ABC-type branched-subunit amino acid transport system substrate-binding protein